MSKKLDHPLQYIDTDLAEAFKEFSDTFPSDTCFMHRHIRAKESIEERLLQEYNQMESRGY